MTIKVTFDMSEAESHELEEFYKIPAMASAIDVLANMNKASQVQLTLKQPQAPETEGPSYNFYSLS